ncbi:MAG: hypothetical protein ACNA8W_08875 [Bradymonadaceae bacterium]
MLSAKLWFLHQLGAHHRLPSEVLERIKTEGRLERWGHGAKIHHEPGVPELYMVLDGQVLIDDATPARDILLRRGDMFGGTGTEPFLGTAQPRPPILRAVDETTLVALETDVFREMTGEHLGHLQSRPGWFGNGRIVEIPVMPLLGTPPASRFARVLLHLLESQGEIEGDVGVFSGPLKSRRLARLSGLDRTRVALLLILFRENDLLRVTGRKVVAPSVETLKSWALGDEGTAV